MTAIETQRDGWLESIFWVNLNFGRQWGSLPIDFETSLTIAKLESKELKHKPIYYIDGGQNE